MSLHIFPDTESQAQFAAEQFADSCITAVNQKGEFRVSLAGGGSYRRMYELLADRKDLPWGQVHIYWGDERCVPVEHKESNAGMSFKVLLNEVPVPADQIHVMRGDLPPAEAAKAYDQLLREQFTERKGLDLLLLGLGDDAHTASLFPGTTVLEEKDHWAAPVYVPAKDTFRLTMTAPFLNRSRQVIFLAHGEKKADAAWQVLVGKGSYQDYPAKLIHPMQGEVFWVLDQEAAHSL